MFPLTSGR